MGNPAKFFQFSAAIFGIVAGGAMGFYFMERAKIKDKQRRLALYLDETYPNDLKPSSKP
ncbi:hypothetical protein BKA69DRAFT_1124052 [Paraphysoderma sedebokerense]|nr:hypothetical protein BKA69DRAFT_1124052 [Paraphysoderma sedebokerense]